MSTTKIRIGGVPEHFNEPWHIAIREKAFEPFGVELQWQIFDGGTGQMTKALREDTCDICILLTEGIVADIVHGNPSKIISGYVKSPLIWGIHSAPNHGVRKKDVYLKEHFAISRKGSGSHLMPVVHALLEGMKPHEDQFKVVQNLTGAIKSLHKDETQVFYWEKYTTKPYVTKGDLIRIDEFTTPWPCFVIAATNKIIESHGDLLDKILLTIHQYCQSFMEMTQAPEHIAETYGLQLADARQWFHVTEWYTHSWVSDKMLKNVLYMLEEAQVIQTGHHVDELVWLR
jgi:ABC-type nitrate/sulfonate/bicarbonate transport system substrate-binding protein